jgi:hypothetical protein
MGGKGSGRRPGTSLAPCGTVARYQRHRKAGEDCSLCREAMRVYVASKYKPRPPRTAPTPRDKKQIVIDAKFERGECAHCNLKVTLDNWIIFEWDHIDPTIKSFGLSNAKAHTVPEILEELSKCQLLCSNCHQLHTYTQGHFYGRIKRLRTNKPEDLFAFGLGNS